MYTLNYMSPRKKKDAKTTEEVSNPEDFFSHVSTQDQEANLLAEIAQKPSLLQTENEDWFAQTYDGQLSVDVYQTKKNILVRAAVAGVRAEDLDIELASDMITIKGVRRMQKETGDEEFMIRECYFGGFSRSIILPVDIQHDKVRATLENGLLTVVLPKSDRPRHSKIAVEEIN